MGERVRGEREREGLGEGEIERERERERVVGMAGRHRGGRYGEREGMNKARGRRVRGRRVRGRRVRGRDRGTDGWLE